MGTIHAPPPTPTARTTTPVVADVAVAVLVGALWLSVQGFRYGVSDNVFHIPFVLRWAQLPAFAGDAFYQTLGNFTSGLWWLVRTFATEGTLEATFLSLHVIGRLGAFVALAMLMRPLLAQPALRWCALLLLAGSPAIRHGSPIGEHEIFGDTLAHSTFLWGAFLAALACAARARWNWAALFTAVTFSLNAFVGIWCGGVLAVAMLAGPVRASLRQTALAGLVFAVVAAPVAMWIFSASIAGDAHDGSFSFGGYIRSYYPAHFLIGYALPLEVANLAALVALALVVGRSRGWTAWNRIVATMAAIFAIGAVAPYLWDNRFLYNLHLLRIDGAIQLVAVALLLLAGLDMALRAERLERRVFGGVLVVACMSAQFVPVLLLWAALRAGFAAGARLLVAFALLFALAALCLWLPAAWSAAPDTGAACALAAYALAMSTAPGRLPRDFALSAIATLALAAVVALAMRGGGLGAGAALETLAGAAFILACRHGEWMWRVAGERLRRAGSAAFGVQTLGVGALVLVLAGLQLAATWQERSRLAAPASGRMADWQAMTQWLREHPQRGPVLVPAEADRALGMHNFQLNARTSVWVDWKQGAAVMWAPSFHATWSPRFHAVQRLAGDDALLAYARANRIPLVLLGGPDGAPECSAGSREVHRNASFALCSIRYP